MLGWTGSTTTNDERLYTVKVSTLSGKKVKNRFDNSDTEKFGFSEETHGLIMSYLSNIYDNPTLAMVRETISNGLDAHTSNGHKGPIQIVVDTSSNPYFEVRDCGVGMSEVTLRKVYTQYGVSTKAKDDTSIGGFGLGCKAALAVEDAFLIETTYDGLTIVAEVYKNGTGEFILDIEDREQTGRESGTVIRTHLKKSDPRVVVAEVLQFLSYVDPDLYTYAQTSPSTGKIETVQPRYMLSPENEFLPMKVSDDVTIHFKQQKMSIERNSNLLRMGQVAYQIPTLRGLDTAQKHLLGFFDLIIDAPIGSVDLPPARESVQETSRSVEFLLQQTKHFLSNIESHYQGLIDASETPVEIYKTRHDAQRLFYASKTPKFTYKGETIVNSVGYDQVLVGDEYKDTSYLLYTKSRGSAGSSGEADYIVLPTDIHTLFVTGYEKNLTNDKEDESDEVTQMMYLDRVRRALPTYLNIIDKDAVYLYLIPDHHSIDLENWWVTKNELITVLSSDDLFARVKEFRSENRKKYAANYGQQRKGPRVEMTYPIVDTTTGRVTQVPVSEIDKDISYIHDSIYREVLLVPAGANRDYDKFVYKAIQAPEKILLLSGTRKESALLKKFKDAKPVKTNVANILTYDQFTKDWAYNQALTRLQDKMATFKNRIGKERFDRLKDPAFHTKVDTKVLKPKGFDMANRGQTRDYLSQLLSQIRYHHKTSLVYSNLGMDYSKFSSQINQMQTSLQGQTSIPALDRIYADRNRVVNRYESFVSIRDRDYDLLVDIYNLIFDSGRI